MALRIRRATAADASAIADVHVRSWQWAYRGLLPDDFLDGMTATIKDRRESHRRRLADESPDMRTWVAENNEQIIGFAATGRSRDDDATDVTGELMAIYLIPEEAGRGVGRALFNHAVQELWQRGYREATLWVLEGNWGARHFYEAAGWTADGTKKTDVRPSGLELHEVRYRASAPGDPTHP